MAQCVDMLLAITTIETAINDGDEIVPDYLEHFGSNSHWLFMISLYQQYITFICYIFSTHMSSCLKYM